MGRSCPVTELPWTELLLAADWGSQPKKGTEAWTAWKSLTEHRPVRPNYGGAKVISWDALEVTMWRWIFREPGFSPTNGKKWFPKGYKVTTQNRCAEKKMRKWFCENNGSDPAHPKHTTLLVLTPKATRPHRFDSVALPKPQQKANTPQSWCHTLLPLQMLQRMCSCAVSTSTPFHTLKSEFSHKWETGSAVAFCEKHPLFIVHSLMLCGAVSTPVQSQSCRLVYLGGLQ